MPTSTPVRAVMTTDVVVLRPEQSVREAAMLLLDRNIDGAPVVDGSGAIVGMLTTSDLIVQEGELHPRAAIVLLGVAIPLGSASHFESELHKVLGASVGEVMAPDPVLIRSDATIGDAVVRMLERRVSRLPVVEDGRLVGIVARGDIVRELLRDLGTSSGLEPQEG